MDLQHIINCLTALHLETDKKNEASFDIENILRMLVQYKKEQDKNLYSELVDLLERLRPIYKEDSDLHQKYEKQRLNFIEQFKKK